MARRKEIPDLEMSSLDQECGWNTLTVKLLMFSSRYACRAKRDVVLPAMDAPC